MRLHLIACAVFTREISNHISKSPNIIDVTWLPQGLHDTPDRLRQAITEAMARAAEPGIGPGGLERPAPDAIVLAYGLCGNGTAGLAARGVPLVIPRTDDCIALLLGSQKRYLELFETRPGTYWLSAGWVERAFLPTPERYAEMEAEYARRYGEENARYLMEQETLWAKKYRGCGYIGSDSGVDGVCADVARKTARYHGWEFFGERGDGSMLERLLDGRWDGDEFLVCPPGHRVEATFGPDRIRAVSG